MTEQTDITSMTIPADVPMALVTGPSDELLRMVQDAFDATITVQGDEVRISGSEEEREAAVTLFTELAASIRAGDVPDARSVREALKMLTCAHMSPKGLREDVLLSYRGRSIRPKTPGQKRYVDAIRDNTITFGIGPAGTGKTYLAMAMAVAALERKEISRIVLSRPIVEAGENLGFLPGTLTEKVDPYIRPLYDALFDMMDAERATRAIERGVIEIAPLAFMRGRTLSDCFIILDEAQNTTREQMKMALTRLGDSSKMIITGDVTQSDLPSGAVGLESALKVLEGIDDIAFVRLKGRDVVRNSLVSQIISAYEADAERRAAWTR